MNVSWVKAADIAAEMGNNTPSNIKRLLRELKEARAIAADLGFDEDDIVDCWRWLRGRPEFPMKQARITTVLLGSPCYLVQWAESIMNGAPSVVFSHDYDEWVRKNARFLRRRGFIYRWPSEESMSDGSRMTYAEARRLGLTEDLK